MEAGLGDSFSSVSLADAVLAAVAAWRQHQAQL